MTKHNVFQRIVSILMTACMILSLTVSSLPIQTNAVNDSDSSSGCTLEEHQHDDSCYEAFDIVLNPGEENAYYESWELATCGFNEHIHSSICEEGIDPICGCEEHVHTDECLDKYYYDDIICGLDDDPEHIHTQDCYAFDWVWNCDLEEHLHDATCYPEQETEEILPEEKAENGDQPTSEEVVNDNQEEAQSIDSDVMHNVANNVVDDMSSNETVQGFFAPSVSNEDYVNSELLFNPTEEEEKNNSSLNTDTENGSEEEQGELTEDIIQEEQESNTDEINNEQNKTEEKDELLGDSADGSPGEAVDEDEPVANQTETEQEGLSAIGEVFEFINIARLSQ